MAPVKENAHLRRQFFHPPRPTKGPPGSAIPIASRISLKTFISLFAGTLCIFFLGVMCWKFGAFLRRFTAHRVVGAKTASVRYAKTWHGWVPLAEHQAKRQRRREILKKARQMVAWRSSHADYSWVWWDPGGSASHDRSRDLQGIRWMPLWLKSYRLHCTDSFKNTVPSANITQHNHTQTIYHAPDANIPTHANPSDSRNLPARAQRTQRRPPISSMLQPLDGLDEDIVSATIFGSQAGPSNIKTLRESQSQSNARQALEPSFYPHSKSLERPTQPKVISPRNAAQLNFTVNKEARMTLISQTLPRSTQGRKRNRRNTFKSPAFRFSTGQISSVEERLQKPHSASPAKLARENMLTWKYKAWAAKMQLQTFNQTPLQLRGLAGRPGSPTSDLLSVMISSCRSSGISSPNMRVASLRKAFRDSTIGGSESRTNRISQGSSGIGIDMGPAWHGKLAKRPSGTLPSRRSIIGHMSPYRSDPASPPNPTQSLIQLPKKKIVLRRTQCLSVADSAIPPRILRSHRLNRSEPLPHSKIQLSNPEVRLVCDLERRLEWLSGEVEPGRKPFHFLILANHWLNKKTWCVQEPASRTPAPQRRLYGDPRFNHPWPDPRNNPPKVKYPPSNKIKACTPRLDSWRLAVNKARRSSGLREYLKEVDLFEGSADEPEDGTIDPACWMLRRPPQGFEMSQKQKDSYYEGIGGWYEKLDDWEKVGRAYRARKIICEGKANRRRIRKIARTVKGRCQKTKRKLTPIQHRPAKKMNARHKSRNEQSGSGSISCQPRHNRRPITRSSDQTSHVYSLPSSSRNNTQPVVGSVASVLDRRSEIHCGEALEPDRTGAQGSSRLNNA